MWGRKARNLAYPHKSVSILIYVHPLLKADYSRLYFWRDLVDLIAFRTVSYLKVFESIQYRYHVIKMLVSQTLIQLIPLIAKRCTGNEVGIYQKTFWCFKQRKGQLEILFYNIHYQRVKEVLLNFAQHTIFTVISKKKKYLERYI